MKKQKHTLMIFFFILSIGFLFQYCKKPDQTLASDNNTTPTPTPVTYPGNQLTAVYTATPYTFATDWSADAAWLAAPTLSCTPVVPNPGQGLFTGYIGKAYDVQMKAMFDSTYIYFWVQYNDLQRNMARPWYFDTVSKGWKQEGSSPTFDINGSMIRPAFQEDKLGVLWNINNSCEAFKTQTCYGSCHIFTPYLSGSTRKPNASGNHYTNYANEKIDMWHFRLVKDAAAGKGSDEYQDYAYGPSLWDTTGGSANGRHVDGQIPNTTFNGSYAYADASTFAIQGSIATQTLLSNQVSGTVAQRSRVVPTWFVKDPGASSGGQFYLDIADTGGANANVVFIIGVDSNGVMSYALNRGGSSAGTIDPRSTDYYPGIWTSNDFTNPPSDGKYCQPSNYASADPTKYPAYRGDIDVKTSWIGGKCNILIRRKLTTSDVLKQDIDFKGYPITTPSSSGIWFQDQPFGIAIFNNANNQHAIKPNLLLHFKTN